MSERTSRFSFDEIMSDITALVCVAIAAAVATGMNWLMSWPWINCFSLFVAWTLFGLVIRLDGRTSERGG
jgi:hypothetical protein